MVMERNWVTVAEASEIAGRAKETLILLVQQRRIPAYKSGSTWLLYKPAVQDYAAFVRATDGMPPTTAIKTVNGPLAFLGHGRTVKWSRKMRYWGNWWEDEQTVRLLEEKSRLEDTLEELCREKAAE